MDSRLAPSARPGMTPKKIRAQPIGPSTAPNMAGQARGEGGRMAGPPTNRRSLCLFRLTRFRRGGFFDHKAVTAQTERNRRRPATFVWRVRGRAARVFGVVGSRVGVLEPIRCSGSSQFALRASELFRSRCSLRDWSQFRHSRRPARACRRRVGRSPSIAPTRQTGSRFWDRPFGLSLDRPPRRRRRRRCAHDRRRKFRPAAIALSARSPRRVWRMSSSAASRERKLAPPTRMELRRPRRADDGADLRRAGRGAVAAAPRAERQFQALRPLLRPALSS